MGKIYIDTNILIGFYESSEDALTILDDLKAYASNLIFPHQTITEFSRNRQMVLRKTINDFSKSTKFNFHCTSIIKHSEHYDDLVKKVNSARDIAKLLVMDLEKSLNAKEDKAIHKIANLISEDGIQLARDDDDMFAAAQKRKLLGNPPFSKDKITICDELIWEVLLASCEDDLVIVTRDRGFLDYETILASEFKRKKDRKLLKITQKLSEALTLIGAHPTEKLINQEKRVDDAELCPKCESPLLEHGYEGSDGDEAHWKECSKCDYIDFEE